MADEWESPSFLYKVIDSLGNNHSFGFIYTKYIKTLGLSGNENILDFGSGSGAGSKHLANLIQRMVLSPVLIHQPTGLQLQKGGSVTIRVLLSIRIRLQSSIFLMIHSISFTFTIPFTMCRQTSGQAFIDKRQIEELATMRFLEM